MTPTLKLTLLGNPEIRVAGTPVKFKYQKSIALLAYLALSGGTHSREMLAGLLWGETTESNARAGLRKSLADLKSQIDAYIIIEQHQVTLNHRSPCSIDADNLLIQVEACRGNDGSDLEPHQAAELAEAIGVYHDDLLAGFHIQRAPGFEEWLMIQRERFRVEAIRGLHILSNHDLVQGNYPQAIHHLERLLLLEPCQEEAHRQLMSLLALNGQRDAALLQYQICCRILHSTLNIDPQSETTALYERIRDQGPQDRPRKQLPLPLTPLFGRQNELSALEAQLESHVCRLISILGPGGSGKTHLALALGDRYRKKMPDTFPDGINFVPLNSLRSLDALPAALIQHLGFYFDKDTPPTQQLQKQLATQQRLIILDNFEHLLKHQSLARQNSSNIDLSFLTSLLQAAPQLKIIITSRVRLNLQDEHVFQLKGIDYSAGNSELGNDAPAPGVKLFIQQARKINPTFKASTKDQIEAITQICHQVAGLPLGILLAAGWSGMLSPVEIAAQLSSITSNQTEPSSKPIDLLSSERGDLPFRQRSLQQVFEYSWILLSKEMQSALTALSIFPDSFDLQAAQQIGEIGLKEIRILVDHSLVQWDTASRFRMHEITRQFAHQKIKDIPTLQDRHCHYYSAQLEQWASAICGPSQLKAIKEIDQEINNILLTWERLLENRQLASLDQALDHICLYYNWCSHFPDGYQLCKNLIGHLDALEQEIQISVGFKALYAKALTWQSVFAPLDQNEPLLRRALDYLPNTDEENVKAVKAFSLARLGRVLSHTGNARTGRAIFEESMAIYTSIEDQIGLANTLNDFGILLWDSAAYDEAQEILQQSLDIHQSLGNLAGAANAMVWLGTVMLFQGQIEGEALVKKSLSLFRDMDNQVKMAESFHTAILALSIMGRYEETHDLLQEKNKLDSDGGIHHHATHTLMADTLCCLGKYEEAHHHAKEGLKLAKIAGDTIIQAHAMVMNGWLCIVDEDFESALRHFQDCAHLSQDHGLKETLSWGLSFVGYSHWQLSHPEQAKQNFNQALLVAAELESFVGIIYALSGGIPIIAHFCSPALALTCYSLIVEYPLLANAELFLDLTRPHIAALKAELSPETFSHANARGKEIGLETLVAEILAHLEA